MERRLVKKYKDFPGWFKSKSYKDIYSAENWLYEIRLRTTIRSLLLSRHAPEGIRLDSFVNWISEERSPMGLYRQIDEEFKPVRDMSVHDALFFSVCARSQQHACNFVKIDELIGEGLRILPEVANSPSHVLIPYEYEKKLQDTVEDIDDDVFDWLDSNAYKYWPGANPWLSFRDAFHGRPITVDTYLDDKTLIESFKKWLKNARQEESEKAIRPFSDQDFEKWNRYKILQVFDIDAWSMMAGIKVTDSALANVLWPDTDRNAEDISPLDRLRKVTRKTISSVINDKAAYRLAVQMTSQNTVNEKME